MQEVKSVVYSTGNSDCPYMIEVVKDMPLIKKSRGDRTKGVYPVDNRIRDDWFNPWMVGSSSG
jgi:hypothetical protein